MFKKDKKHELILEDNRKLSQENKELKKQIELYLASDDGKQKQLLEKQTQKYNELVELVNTEREKYVNLNKELILLKAKYAKELKKLLKNIDKKYN